MSLCMLQLPKSSFCLYKHQAGVSSLMKSTFPLKVCLLWLLLYQLKRDADSPKTIVRAQHLTPSPVKADRLSRSNVLDWLKRHPKRFGSPPLLRDMQPFPAHKNLHASFEQFLPELVAGARSQAALVRKKLDRPATIPSMHVSPPSEPPGPPEPLLPPAKRQRMSNTSNAAVDDTLRAGYELGKGMLAHRIPHVSHLSVSREQ